MTTKIVMYKEIPKNARVVEAFPSKGFVSTIATKHMMNELGMEQVGHIESDSIQQIAVIHDSEPMRPMRIYAKGKLLFIFSEIIIPFQHVAELSGALEGWFDEIKPKEVILLAGISGKGTDKRHEIHGIGSQPKLNDKLEELGASKIADGMLTGLSSNLLLYCIDKDIPAISLMAETEYIPDPLAAASMINILNKLLGVTANTESLINEGTKIEGMFNDMSAQMKRGKDGYKEMEAYSPMYG